MRMAAAVSKVAGQPLEMEEVEVAPPRAHEVRIRILCTSLCHTDLTFWRMEVRTDVGGFFLLARFVRTPAMTRVPLEGKSWKIPGQFLLLFL